ncbi:hypothetical protein F511_12937 [Dorcoceras hygrometricum]|uniref:Uncharacterized protein n=1 Tax=Dorcoceras hygrometricum TaxID=472368 RepID=A0A2Z7D6C3_9LAMI|nr:hypothetical protein F511_12937 [Dorcoceras hygrometricum]
MHTPMHTRRTPPLLAFDLPAPDAHGWIPPTGPPPGPAAPSRTSHKPRMATHERTTRNTWRPHARMEMAASRGGLGSAVVQPLSPNHGPLRDLPRTAMNHLQVPRTALNRSNTRTD